LALFDTTPVFVDTNPLLVDAFLAIVGAILAVVDEISVRGSDVISKLITLQRPFRCFPFYVIQCSFATGQPPTDPLLQLTFCIQLEPPLFVYSDQMMRILQEALEIMDADDVSLIGRTS
jgi:hypothetical protein